jgi:hypothetical protein
LEKENRELGREILENEAAQELTNAKAAEIFAFLDEVSLASWHRFVPWSVGAGLIMGVTPFTFTGLREMEGAPCGGCASVDTVDCRDSELRSPLTVEQVVI